MAAGQDHAGINVDNGELAQGLRLAVIALASAVLTATVVIGVGGAWLDSSDSRVPSHVEAPVRLVRTSG